MYFSLRNIFKFVFLYSCVILVTNFITGLIHTIWGISIFGGSWTSLKLPFPSIWAFRGGVVPEGFKTNLKIDYLGLIANLLLFLLSYYLVFLKKIKPRIWIIFFIIFSLATTLYFFFFENTFPNPECLLSWWCW
jgi:hypothetical protein